MAKISEAPSKTKCDCFLVDEYSKIQQKVNDNYKLLKAVLGVPVSKSGEVLLLDGCGHMGHLEAPTTTLRAVKHFAERVLY